MSKPPAACTGIQTRWVRRTSVEGMRSMSDLSGKAALVTGASRGVGRGIALVLAEKGADVVVNYRSSQDQAAEVAAEIEAMGRRALAIQGDVSDSADVERLFARTRSTFGKLDILVNNAGTTKGQDIFEMTEADWDFVLRTDLKSCFLCAKAAMDIMRRQSAGRIVNIGSVVSHRGALYGHVHYAAAKSGILGFTKSLARELGSRNIRVNAVAPGFITGVMTDKLSDEARDALLREVPLQRLGEPDDVAGVVSFLASDLAGYVTGQVVVVDGGMVMH